MEALEGKPNLYLVGELWIDAQRIPAVERIELYHPVLWGRVITESGVRAD
jgi:hypothetical protein